MRRTTLSILVCAGLTLPACSGVDETSTQTSTTTTTTGSAGAGGESGGAGGGGGTAGTGGTGGEGGSPIPKVELVWEPCPLFSDGTGPDAECTRPKLPLRASEPTGPTIDYYVKRYSKAGSTPTKQFWMLSGGPGASGIIYEKRAELLVEEDNSLEIYIPDHRGVGDSTRIGCPVQEGNASANGFFIAPSEWPKCWAAVEAKWGDDLPAFNVTNSANDLGILVESAKQDNVQTFVYGASYGSYWAHRYMQLFPKQADGVILDAIAPPGAALARIDVDMDEAADDLFLACADDPTCGPKLGGDPRAFALDLYDRLDMGECPGIQQLGPGRILLRRSFGQMMMTWNARRLIPAVLARADRCLPEDVAAISVLFDYYFTLTPASELLFREWGWVLSDYIVLSELYGQENISVEQMAAWRDAAAVSRDVTSRFEASLKAVVKYPVDEYHLTFAQTDVPLLMLEGTWDPATRPEPAKVMKENFKGQYQTWVDVPRGAHGILGSVPDVDGNLCGTAIVKSFLNNPKSAPDTSCLANLAPLSFDGEAPLNQILLGTDDAWGGL